MQGALEEIKDELKQAKHLQAETRSQLQAKQAVVKRLRSFLKAELRASVRLFFTGLNRCSSRPAVPHRWQMQKILQVHILLGNLLKSLSLRSFAHHQSALERTIAFPSFQLHHVQI